MVRFTIMIFLFLFILISAFVQAPISSAQITPTPTVSPIPHHEWDIRDTNGIKMNKWSMAGSFNINTKVSCPNPILDPVTNEWSFGNYQDFDDLIKQAEFIGFNFFCITDNSVNLSPRAFFLQRGVALARANLEKVGISGFRWIGDAGITQPAMAQVTVVGCDSFVYYSPGGNKTIANEAFREQDFINPNLIDSDNKPIYQSERNYVTIVKNGTFRYRDLSFYEGIKLALDQYIAYWAGYDVNLEVVLGGETLKELRKDMETRLDQQNESLNIRTPKSNFNELFVWLQSEVAMNKYISGMICYPVGASSVEDWGKEFFKHKYNESTVEAFPLVEVKAKSSGIDDTLYRTALSNGWKVSPATSLNNVAQLVENDANFFTGVWSQKPQVTDDKRQLMLYVLEGIRNRKTYVSNSKETCLRLNVFDRIGQTIAIMGDTITQDQGALIQLNLGVDKSQDRIYVMKPKMVVIYNDGTSRSYPFNSYYQDISGNAPGETRIDRVYMRSLDSFKNIKCFYAVVDCYKIMKQYGSKIQYDDSWSYYKLWKYYFLLGKLSSESYQLISAPIFVKL